MKKSATTVGFFGRGASPTGFSLIEVLAAMAVLALLMVVLFSAVNQTGSLWQRAKNQAGAYQSGRFAFDQITSTLAQSTLNVSYGYDNATKPTKYIRKSDLHFVIDPPPIENFGQGNAIFFQAPLGRTGSEEDDSSTGTDEKNSPKGLPGLLNAVGYYIIYGKDPGLPPILEGFDRNRFRLMQFIDPSEKLKVYEGAKEEAPDVNRKDRKAWFLNDDLEKNSTVIAENVILLLFWPRLSVEEDPDGDELTKDYLYNSRDGTALAQKVTTNQQPPMVQVTMVALDETSANRLGDDSTPPEVIESALQGLFTTSTVDDYTEDLETLEDRLNQAGIGHRVFTGTVTIRESRWTK